MRTICIIFFVVVLGFRPIIPIVEYIINFEYISEVLCINKDKPEMQCNGKCHLMKNIAKTTEESSNQNQEKNQTSFVKVLDHFISMEQEYRTVSVLASLKSNLLTYYAHTKYSFIYLSSPFKPPII